MPVSGVEQRQLMRKTLDIRKSLKVNKQSLNHVVMSTGRTAGWGTLFVIAEKIS